MQTSPTHPLRIAPASGPGISGVIGITFCPGKQDGIKWCRDLDVDLAAILEWKPDVVVTLLESHEFTFLKVERLPAELARLGMRWLHLPIRDVDVPDARFEKAWATVGVELRHRLRAGGRVVLH